MHITCCKNCTKRVVGCHTNCENYQKEIEKNRAAKEALDLERKLDDYDWAMWRSRRRMF